VRVDALGQFYGSAELTRIFKPALRVRNALFIQAMEATWADDDPPEFGAANLEWLNGFYDAIFAAGRPGGAYQNFPDPDLKDWRRSYYGDNYPRLVEVKRWEATKVAVSALRDLRRPGPLFFVTMADLVHLTPERGARRITRSGIAARSRGWFADRGVYCMPVLPSFTLTHQWVRELRRWHPGALVAVHVRLPDGEPVTVGRYGQRPSSLTAAQAAAMVRGLDDPRGYEVFVPRAITADEVRRVRRVPQRIGWRYQPDAHGRAPCACPVCLAPGSYKAAEIRRRFSYQEPRPTKRELMAALHAATTSDETVDALLALGGRRRGGAEELEYLADHPDPEVREVLAEILELYRGRAARALRDRLAASPTAARSDPEAAPDPL
jgi:hypothetical protein